MWSYKAYRDTKSKTEREEDGHGQSKSEDMSLTTDISLHQ